ncbi:hypothetical protein WJX84_011560 [Apatococcus fuscideae]|uniref:Uncharacterized protein n=1 Tax=Apatococcus fuscideae TaxID=2026836 RepID=A0AAW1SPA5_9CHLO
MTKSADGDFMMNTDGSGLQPCHICLGQGFVPTRAGGAGVPFKVGTARCKMCRGQGVMSCPLCAGYEIPLRPPDPFRGPPEEPATDDIIEQLGLPRLHAAILIRCIVSWAKKTEHVGVQHHLLWAFVQRKDIHGNMPAAIQLPYSEGTMA